MDHQPASELPTISTNAAIIDGYSQPGAAKNTLAQGDNAKLAIALDGTGAGSTVAWADDRSARFPG